ncbi:hypothetical protein OCU04_000329 [Sclerotinia nivalis]|uniref:Uncharacterized protein n=1 Tax=Sclerotinia nivalis TaxID=352851 RepID=A0A9X0AVW2_9HELO|nr:hypothetical protein OCU04_000329 [Sclerotinia nivalis]
MFQTDRLDVEFLFLSKYFIYLNSSNILNHSNIQNYPIILDNFIIPMISISKSPSFFELQSRVWIHGSSSTFASAPPQTNHYLHTKHPSNYTESELTNLSLNTKKPGRSNIQKIPSQLPQSPH